jgi:uncharacterized protein YyaL (SSP411 family)
MPEQSRPNRLVHEKSPYLQKHATNPVDWYPWGREAFERAGKEDKPVFLSIGYSTCHWCNVMEEESFSDPEVASLMNDAFVSVKVDREERPDIDNVYMSVCTMMAGSGGWPLTVIMTPEKKPFFAGTYFPKRSMRGRIGMMELIPRVKTLWQTERDKVLNAAEEVTASLLKTSGNIPGGRLGESVLDTAFEGLSRIFDFDWGGFGEAPKFPMPHYLFFLLRYGKRKGEPRALKMVEHTLEGMRLGGMYDHLGGGFHRYSTDREWLLPHFEKMLYDQALLALACLEAFQATGRELFARTAREVFSYVLREMASPEGAFFTAQSADVEGEEGKSYLWSMKEVREVLGEEDAALFARVFGLTEEGNVIDPVEGERTGKNVLHLKEPPGEAAAGAGVTEAHLENLKGRLLEARGRRRPPDTDQKVLADCNGVMAAALARAAQVLGEDDYAEAARRAVRFILGSLRDQEGRLLHRYRDGEAAVPANADDYAFLIWSLIELYEADFDAGHLTRALELMEEFVRHFWKEDTGGFYFTADYAEPLIVRKMEFYDAAIPSANAVSMLNLLRLARLTGRRALEERAVELEQALAGNVRESPSAHMQFLAALDFALGPSHEVVVAGGPGAPDTREMLSALRSRFIPNAVVLLRPSGEEEPPIAGLAGFTREMAMSGGRATAYVCREFACELPTTDTGRMLELLGEVS